jgi:hypothetical protein
VYNAGESFSLVSLHPITLQNFGRLPHWIFCLRQQFGGYANTKGEHFMPTTKKGGAKGTAKASGQSQAVTGGSVLTVKASSRASIIDLAFKLQQAYKQRGCPGCRSGIDRIVFENQGPVNTK